MTGLAQPWKCVSFQGLQAQTISLPVKEGALLPAKGKGFEPANGKSPVAGFLGQTKGGPVFFPFRIVQENNTARAKAFQGFF